MTEIYLMHYLNKKVLKIYFIAISIY